MARSYRWTTMHGLLPTERTVTGGTFSPTALASIMQRTSLATSPGNRSGSGLMMCVLGVLPSGSAMAAFRIMTGNLDCAPANESRSPSRPAISGRRGSSVTISSNSRSLSSRTRVSPMTGAGASSGSRLTAPAHSPPIRSSMAKSLRSLIPRIAAISFLGSSSGRMPAKNGRACFPRNVPPCSGSDRERGMASGLPVHSGA